MDNERRAECAAYALDEYGLRKEGRADYDPVESMIADLMADLLHLARAHNATDPVSIFETAKMNFQEEEASEVKDVRS